MVFLGLVITVALFFHYKSRLARLPSRAESGDRRRHGARHHRRRRRRRRNTSADSDEALRRRALRRATIEAVFHTHVMSYLGVMVLLAFINLLTTRYPWFLWAAAGWGLGLFVHYMAVFGSQSIKKRYVDPVVHREVQLEKAVSGSRLSAPVNFGSQSAT